jgi:hypothetical protein
MEAIRLALGHKADLARMVAAADQGGLELVQGASVRAVWLFSQLARDLGIVAALGSDRQGKLALWQVIARVLDQGSRLSAVPLAGGHAAGAAHGMIGFDEDDVYANLDWLAQHQAAIETRLFAQRKAASAPDVFLAIASRASGRSSSASCPTPTDACCRSSCSPAIRRT